MRVIKRFNLACPGAKTRSVAILADTVRRAYVGGVQSKNTGRERAMSLNPFKTVGDYPMMLNKIAASTFLVALGGLALLRHEFVSVRSILDPVGISIPIESGLSLPLGLVLPALLFAILSRMFKLHDRVSDLFRIRQRFDVSEILFPLAMGSGPHLTTDQMRAIKKNRESLMYKVFYKYASSTPGKAVIDSHYITMALDQWCWYWVVIEATVIAFVLAATFLLTRHYLLADVLFIAVLAALGVLQLLRKFCSDYALQEVEAILQQADRKLEVAEVFRAL